MERRFERRGATRAAVAAVKDLISDVRSSREPFVGDSLNGAGAGGAPRPDTMSLHLVVGGRVALTLDLPLGSPLPTVGDRITVGWPYGNPEDADATMTYRVRARDFHLEDGAPPVVGLQVEPVIPRVRAGW
jgi:hypothetical protein